MALKNDRKAYEDLERINQVLLNEIAELAARVNQLKKESIERSKQQDMSILESKKSFRSTRHQNKRNEKHRTKSERRRESFKESDTSKSSNSNTHESESLENTFSKRTQRELYNFACKIKLLEYSGDTGTG